MSSPCMLTLFLIPKSRRINFLFMVSQTVYELIARSHRIADCMLKEWYQCHYRYVDTFYVVITAMQMLRNQIKDSANEKLNGSRPIGLCFDPGLCFMSDYILYAFIELSCLYFCFSLQI